MISSKFVKLLNLSFRTNLTTQLQPLHTALGVHGKCSLHPLPCLILIPPQNEKTNFTRNFPPPQEKTLFNIGSWKKYFLLVRKKTYSNKIHYRNVTNSSWESSVGSSWEIGIWKELSPFVIWDCSREYMWYILEVMCADKTFESEFNSNK